MSYCTILVELAGDSGLEPRLHVARRLADRFDATLVGMHVMPLPFIPASYGEATAYLGLELIEAQREANREISAGVHAVFRRICGAAPNVTWQEVEGDPGRLLTEAARTTDLILARRANIGSADVPDVLDQLVTAAGVPVLALPAGFSSELGETGAWRPRRHHEFRSGGSVRQGRGATVTSTNPQR
jgi:nucleotide-binding universal stress UspA family protein